MHIYLFISQHFYIDPLHESLPMFAIAKCTLAGESVVSHSVIGLYRPCATGRKAPT